jgi:hypothetical protein
VIDAEGGGIGDGGWPSHSGRATLWLRRPAGEAPVISGPEQGVGGRGRLRASSADREQVIDTLKTAFADGRLDKDELDARVGRALAARTYADLAVASAGIPAAPAPVLPRRPARPPANKDAVKWGLVAAAAMIPPAMFVTSAYAAHALALLALPLLLIELPVAIIVAIVTLARQRADRSRASRGHLPPRHGQAGRAAAAERHASTGPDPALRVGLRVHKSRRGRRHMPAEAARAPSGAHPAPGAA